MPTTGLSLLPEMLAMQILTISLTALRNIQEGHRMTTGKRSFHNRLSLKSELFGAFVLGFVFFLLKSVVIFVKDVPFFFSIAEM